MSARSHSAPAVLIAVLLFLVCSVVLPGFTRAGLSDTKISKELPNGTRVIAILKLPEPYTCVTRGSTGTIVCYLPLLNGKPYVVDWDLPVSCGYGHDPDCGASGSRSDSLTLAKCPYIRQILPCDATTALDKDALNGGASLVRDLWALALTWLQQRTEP